MEFNLMLVDLPWYLRKIDLSNSDFTELEDMRGNNWTDVTFQRFSYVAELVLKNAGLWTLTNEMFLKLKNLLVLHTDSYQLICIAQNEANLKLRTFTPPKDAIASCEDLIENAELRIVLWVLGWFAFLGNILFIIRRLVKQKGALTKIKILDLIFLNLHIADAIMGVYCIIIASADEHYRGRYIENAEIWKQGGLCQFAGFIFTLAAEIPFIALPIAAVEESIYAFFDLKFRKEFGNKENKEKPPFPQWISLKRAAAMLGVSWFVLAFLAIVPLFGIPYFGNKFYAKSTVCLPVYIAGDLPVGFGYTAFLFIIFNFCASMALIACYVFMFAVDTQREVEYDDEGEAIEEMAFSHRLFAVSFTNLSCWLPVVLFGMAGWHGSPVSVDLTPWAALIMIPINAAVNPLIYMIFPDKKRDLGADKGKDGKPGAKPGQGGAKPGQGGAKAVQGGAKAGQGGAKAGQGGAKPGPGGAKPGQGGGKPGQSGAKAGQGRAMAGASEVESAVKAKGGQAQARGKGKVAGAAKDDIGSAGDAEPSAKGQAGGKVVPEEAKIVAKEGDGGSPDVAKASSGNAQVGGPDASAGETVDEGVAAGEGGGTKVSLKVEVHRSDEKGDTTSDDSGVSGSKSEGTEGSHEDAGTAEGSPDQAKETSAHDVDAGDTPTQGGKGNAKDDAKAREGSHDEGKAGPVRDGGVDAGDATAQDGGGGSKDGAKVGEADHKVETDGNNADGKAEAD
ncbi:PREDICTED: uncharacterized protein LOC109479026 [Branchiostoma belcheri]|uniref:Uncharacterized protein LOC109479026 n=1 Tax=Branchiostoma belcheri TaxID=7741 RepID=A0A6P4ZZN0_BRABE|nr:PREDICTED: uncharacterized protein LOC109479026 [Branchiostoma belcheri]